MSKPAMRRKTYKVGYGRPPEAHRFKAGKSGNPRGRPKGTRPVGAVLQQILEQRVAVTENGRTRKLPALEVMLRRLALDALRSEPKALKLMLSLVDRYADTSEASLPIDDILEEDRTIIAKYLTPSAPQTSSKRTRTRNEA